MAEGTRLLSEYGDQNSIAGSNPALSVQLAQLPCDLGTSSAEDVLQARAVQSARSSLWRADPPVPAIARR